MGIAGHTQVYLGYVGSHPVEELHSEHPLVVMTERLNVYYSYNRGMIVEILYKTLNR